MAYAPILRLDVFFLTLVWEDGVSAWRWRAQALPLVLESFFHSLCGRGRSAPSTRRWEGEPPTQQSERKVLFVSFLLAPDASQQAEAGKAGRPWAGTWRRVERGKEHVSSKLLFGHSVRTKWRMKRRSAHWVQRCLGETVSFKLIGRNVTQHSSPPDTTYGSLFTDWDPRVSKSCQRTDTFAHVNSGSGAPSQLSNWHWAPPKHSWHALGGTILSAKSSGFPRPPWAWQWFWWLGQWSSFDSWLGASEREFVRWDRIRSRF